MNTANILRSTSYEELTIYYRDLNSFWVAPSREDRQTGVDHGTDQEMDSRAKGLKDEHGCDFSPERSLHSNRLSGITEVSVRDALGFERKLRYGVGNVADAPGDIQVRLISSEDGTLTVRGLTGLEKKCDKDWWRVVGVVIPNSWKQPYNIQDALNLPYYRIAGWYNVRDARVMANKETGGEHPEWYFAKTAKRPRSINIPQGFLRPMSELVEILRSEGHVIDTSRVIYPFK